MKLQDALKLAHPGPMSSQGSFIGTLQGGVLDTVADASDHRNRKASTVEQRNATAALLAHGYNTLGPVLKLLQGLKQTMDDEYPATDHRHPSRSGLDVFIKELDKVEL